MESCLQQGLESPHVGAGNRIPDALSERIVRAYRGWHQYEAREGGPPIIDFDLSDLLGQEQMNSRSDVLRELEDISEQLSTLLSDEAEFLRGNLRGSEAYLRTLMGEQIPFPAYLRATLGIEAELFQATQIEEAKSSLESLLSSIGLRFDRASKPLFYKDILTDPEEIKREILSGKDLWLDRLAEAGIPVPKQLPLKVKFSTVDEYWSNWIEGNVQDGLTLTINLHVRSRYSKGRALFLCLHEICGHAVQMSLWRDRIAGGAMSQACGITTVHSPEAFLAEGLGQTVPDLLSDFSYSSDFLISRALRFYNLLVLHNAHLRLYQQEPVDLLLTELAETMPFTDQGELESQLRDRGTNPLFRTYLLSYSAGEARIRSLIAANPAGKGRMFRMIYTTPMTPQQFSNAFPSRPS